MWLRLGLACLAVAVATLAAPQRAWACSCMRSFSPCEAFAMDVVFVGEVLTSERVGSSQRMRLRVIRAFKGVDAREVDVWSDVGTSCGLALDVGERYVIHTGRGDRIQIRVCGSVVEWLRAGEPEPDLPPRPGHIYGRVSVADLQRIRDSEPLEAVAGASVWIDAPTGRVSTTTDGRGDFTFSDVPPGIHPLGVDAGPDLAPWNTEPVTLDGPTACASASLLMHPSGRIAGRVMNHDGSPAAGIPLLLLAADASEGSPEEVVAGEPTGKDGRFDLDGLSPGAYLLTLNVDAASSQGRPPYPPTWFGGTSRGSAARLQVGRGLPAELPAPFVLPPPRPTRTVTVTVTCADGTVPPYAHASVTSAGGNRSSAPNFERNVLTMLAAVDRAHTLEITASIPYGAATSHGRARRGEELHPLLIPAGESDERFTVVAPFSDCHAPF